MKDWKLPSKLKIQIGLSRHCFSSSGLFCRSPPDGIECEMAEIDKITWAQVGRDTKLGRYMFKFGWLTITAADLSVWDNYPGAAFTLTRLTCDESYVEEFKLGSFSIN